MHQFSVVFTVLSVFFLSVLAAPLNKRQNYGRGTWFYDYTNESACGNWDQSNDLIVAVSAQIYNSGALCGRQVQIMANGITEYATVRDECQGCGPNDLDMSEGLFEKYADLDVGVLSIVWELL